MHLNRNNSSDVHVCPHVTDRKPLRNFTKTCGQIPLLFTPRSNVGQFAWGSNRVISHISRAALDMTWRHSSTDEKLSCWMWHPVHSHVGTNASEQLDASFFSKVQENSSYTTLKMEAVSSSETLEDTHQAMLRRISEGCNNIKLST
jgi:hypothetical protein